MGFWDRIKKDIKKGYEEGLSAIKEGSVVVKKKAGELAEEGKKQIKLFELKQKVQGRFTDLGGRVYDLVSSKKESPLQDAKVKSTISSITKLEEQITTLEKKPEKPVRKKTTKKPVKKATVRAKKKPTASKTKAAKSKQTPTTK